MTLVLCRIDDRLIHGQVLVGWGRPLEIGRIVLVDDAVAVSPMEQDLYRMAVTDGAAVEFLAPAQAGPRLAELAAGPERVLVLAGSVEVMAGLARFRPGVIRAINVGGIHDGPGRREYLRYVYLTPAELATLATLAREGVVVTAQDLPDARPVPVSTWTEGG
jgi:PTS system mannose-specific IIB component/fructoselysine and glucoselysine-specific PTS system IIB component